MAKAMTRARPQAPATTANGGERTRPASIDRPAQVFRPLTDIYETDKGVVLALEMPGVGPDGVEVTLEDGVLTIYGHAEQARPEGYRQITREYGEGDYTRVFTLSEDIDEARVSAVCRDGVLTLELPIAEPAKPRRISVKAA